MNLRGEEESPLSKASARDLIRQSDVDAERAALRDAADAAAALAAALGPSQVTQGAPPRPNPYEAAAKSKARDALKMPPRRPRIGRNGPRNMPVPKNVQSSKPQGLRRPRPLGREWAVHLPRIMCRLVHNRGLLLGTYRRCLHL